MNLSPEVSAYITKAHHALKVAEKLVGGEDYPDAAGKAYYAMFYAAQALLKAHGLDVVKHSAVTSLVGREFAKTGRLDSRFHRMLINARRVRETADYGIFEDVTASTARKTLEDANSFIIEVERILQA